MPTALEVDHARLKRREAELEAIIDRLQAERAGLIAACRAALAYGSATDRFVRPPGHAPGEPGPIDRATFGPADRTR